MVVIGDKEVENGGVSPRLRTGEDLKFLPLDEFISLIQEESKVPR